MDTRSFRALGACTVLIVVGATTGCVANSSNPLVTARSASMSDTSVALVLELANPGGRNLVVNRLSYQLSHGDMAFPVASGGWQGTISLPAGGDAILPLAIEFEQAPIDPDSMRLHLSGDLYHTDRTGFLGIPSLDLESTAFTVEIEAIKEPSP